MLTTDCPDRRTLQSQIDSTLEIYHKKIRRLEALDVEVTFDTLLETNGRKALITVEDGFSAEIERLETLGKFSSAGKHKSALLALQTYQPAKIALEMVDLDYLKGFEMYLRKRGNGNNSIATRFAIFKAIYNKAVKEGRFEPKKNPFTTYKVGSLWTATRKRAITKQEIQKIAELQFPSDRRSWYLQFSRDVFLFSYFTAGMNFCDIARLRYRDIGGGRVNYSRHKTQKLLSCRLSEQAKAVVERYCNPFYNDDDYVFPILNKTVHITEKQAFHRIVKVLRKVNLSLKNVGEQAGLSFPLTTYKARHSILSFRLKISKLKG
jgi:integrase